MVTQDDIKESSIWNVTEFTTTEKAWADKNSSERALTVLILTCKAILAILLLYLFIISLGLMANSFRILGGKSAGRAFRDSELFDNPIAGLVTGIIVTVLVQSSSTSTSIIITMTAGDLIEIDNAIPMIMGANIGTSVTNTLVSLGSFNNKDEYRRAFAGATVHDCFNFLTVLLLLPIEWATGMLQESASAICNGLDITDEEEKGSKVDFLKTLTKPVGSRLLGIDKKLITKIAAEKDPEKLKAYEEKSIIKHGQKDDNNIFLDTPMSDGVAGVLMVIVSLLFLTICLMMLVKLLQTIFRGHIAIWFRKAMNLETPCFPALANYILIVFGMGITILFQSSSVTTSTLTPLVGIGLVRIDKMFAFTVGANLGTTLTGVLAASVSDKRKTGLTVAFSHVLFNLLGTLLWYPVPFIRSMPINMARTFGDIAADVKWFPIAYVLFVFMGLPMGLLGLSIISPWLCLFVGVPTVLFLLALCAVIRLRANRWERLPGCLRYDPSFSWFPNALRFEQAAAEADTMRSASAGAVSADLGANNWHAAPAAWGTGWFVLLALVTVVFNAKWADMKYTSWDKRNHYGISAWEVCSYAFLEDQDWAPVRPATCVAGSCGAESLKDCTKTSDFANVAGANEFYQDSWEKCRGQCTGRQWQSWCEEMNCLGSDHKLQCKNVTKAVYRPYTVEYGPAGKKAWKAGARCRPLEDVCTGVDSIIPVAGNFAVVGLVFVGLGQITLIGASMWQDRLLPLVLSLASYVFAWAAMLVSWTTFAGATNTHATCIVEDESGAGAVMASGRFGDITNGNGSYTFGFVIGAWLLSVVTIALIALRVRERMFKRETPSVGEESVAEKEGKPPYMMEQQEI